MAEVDRTTGLVGYSGVKVPVLAATTAAITLSGEQTIDGVAVVTNDRVLVKDQVSAVDNGIYVADTGAWSRSADADGIYDFVFGSLIPVAAGTVSGRAVYQLTTTGTITPGTSSLAFTAMGLLSAPVPIASGGTGAATAGGALTNFGFSAYFQTLIASATAIVLRALFTPLTTKGDLWGFSTVDARIAVGANGTVPVASSAATAGLAYVAALNKAIYGLTYANNVADATNDIDIAAGGCMDATGAYWLTLAALTKQSDAAWAVGSAAGGLDTGVVGNSDYYIWAIARSDTGITDVLFSLSSTAPTMPANYDFKRLIGWFKRTGGTIVAFHTYETEGGGIEMNWDVPTLDINLAATLTTTRRTDAVKVPLNFSTISHLNVVTNDATSGQATWIYCPDQTDAAPSPTVAPLSNSGLRTTAGYWSAQMFVRTSAAGLIAARSDLATVDLYAVSTMGFTWARRN